MWRNIGSNWFTAILTVVSTFVITPFLVRTLGQEGYGTWALITAFTGYLSLLMLGIPMASVRYLAEYATAKRQTQFNEATGTCLGLYLFAGAAAIAGAAGLLILFDATYKIPSALRSEADWAFALVALSVAGSFVAALPESILAAHHDFVLRNLIVTGLIALRLGLILALMRRWPSVVMLAVIQTVWITVDLSVSWLLIRHRYRGTRLRLGDFRWGMARQIFSFGVYVLILNLAIRLSLQSDALVIGALLDIDRIPFYVVANSFLVYLMDFVVAIAAVVMPMATRLKTLGDLGALREIFLRWSKIAFSLTMTVSVFLIVLGDRFIGWWINPSFEGPSGQVLRTLMVSALVFLPVRGVALPVLMGLGKFKLPSLTFLAAGVVNVTLSLLLAHPLGLVGVALGTAIPNALFAVVLVIVTCRELGATVSDYVRYVVPRYIVEGKSYLTIAIGCTGGRHRSVMIAERLKRALVNIPGVAVRVRHRDIRRA